MPRAVTFSATGFSTLDTTSGPESLGPVANRPGLARLLVLENGRVTQEGGVRVRNGFLKDTDLMLGERVDDLETHPVTNTLFAKCGTKVLHNNASGSIRYDVGVTQTASEKTFLFPYRKNMFAVNLTDASVRIAVSTVAAIDSGAGTFSLKAGDGAAVPFASGTVYIRGAQVTGGTLSTDEFSGCSGLTASMQVGDIVTQTSTPSGMPKGTCMAEFNGSAIVGNGPSLYWSEPSSPADPELFWSFPATYVKSMPSDVTALKEGNSVLLIGLKRGMQYSNGFDQATGVLYTLPITSTYGVPNARCLAQMDDEFAVQTNDGRTLPVAQTDAGFKVIANPDDPRQDMDYPVQGYVQKNIDRETLDENFLHYDPATRELSSVLRMNTGLTREFVLQRDIRAWSNDTGKNFRCKANYNGRTYAGDDADSLIHLDVEGWTDNGVPINFRVQTGLLRAARKGITCDYLGHDFGGLLNPTGQFYMRVLLDGDVVENKLFKATGSGSLRTLMLMDVDTGVGIGSGQVGAEQIGSGGSVADAFKFDVPYEFMGDAEQASVEFETTDEATILELRYFDLYGETEGESLLTHL